MRERGACNAFCRADENGENWIFCYICLVLRARAGAHHLAGHIGRLAGKASRRGHDRLWHQISLDAKRFGIGQWWLVLLLAALTCVIGLLLVIRPSDAARALMVLMGISLLLDGILNICVAWFCVKIVRNQRPDGIDEEYEELKDE